MRIGYVDPFSGASGDMLLGALVDAGLSLDRLRELLAAGLELSGYEISADRAQQHGLTGTRVTVSITEAQPARAWQEIRSLLERAVLPERARGQALAVFQALAEAEAQVHRVPPAEVHFHELGAVDSIVDIVGIALGLELLGIEALYSGPLPLGRGFVQTQHGLLPIPAPATAALLAGARAPTRPLEVEAELVTPTGAAVLATLARFEQPPMRVEAVGYGFGTRELPWPNALRLWVGEAAGEATGPFDEGPEELLLEANIDDMNPEFFEPLVDRLFEAGALDVWLEPITMKRGRPGTKVSAICRTTDRAELERIFIEHSTTFGVRALPIDRVKAGRRTEQIATRWGDVRIKLKLWRGRVIDAVPEYRDCLAIHERTGMPIRLVYNEAARIAEAWIGRKVEAGIDRPTPS